MDGEVGEEVEEAEGAGGQAGLDEREGGAGVTGAEGLGAVIEHGEDELGVGRRVAEEAEDGFVQERQIAGDDQQRVGSRGGERGLEAGQRTQAGLEIGDQADGGEGGVGRGIADDEEDFVDQRAEGGELAVDDALAADFEQRLGCAREAAGATTGENGGVDAQLARAARVRDAAIPGREAGREHGGAAGHHGFDHV